MDSELIVWGSGFTVERRGLRIRVGVQGRA